MAKRSEQLPLTQIPGTKKLAILSYSATDVSGFELYVENLDLNSIYASSSRRGKYSDIKPRIQYSGADDWVGCFLNSTFYIFHECRSKFDYIYINESGDMQIRFFEGMPPLKQSAKKFVLSPEFLDSDIEILEGIDAFEELPDMKWPKSCPIAVPTPDGKKILVFQQSIEMHYEKTCFELYDTEVDAWNEIKLECPEFPPWKVDETINIEEYYFQDESTFMASTSLGPIVVHLKPEEEKKKNPPSVIYHVYPFIMKSVTIDGKVIISAGSAYRLGSGDAEIRFKLSSPPANLLQFPAGQDILEPAQYFITLLDVDKDEYAVTLCSLPRRCRNIIHSCYLTIDVCHTDLVTLETTIVDTLRYVIPRVRGSIIWRLEMFII